MRKIMEEQRQNELYHDDKKRQEIILYRKGIHDRAAVPLPPSNSLDVIIYEFNNYTCNNFSWVQLCLALKIWHIAILTENNES